MKKRVLQVGNSCNHLRKIQTSKIYKSSHHRLLQIEVRVVVAVVIKKVIVQVVEARIQGATVKYKNSILIKHNN